MRGSTITILALSLALIAGCSAGTETVVVNSGISTGHGKRSYPSMGVTMASFKTSFNSFMQDAASKKKALLPPQQLETDGELSFSFPDHTSLRVFAADRKSVSQLVMVGNSNHPQQLWCCTEAMISALNPAITAGDRQTILTKLGKRNTDDIPTAEAKFESGMVEYSFNRNGDRWILQGFPSMKATEDEIRRLRPE